MIHHRYFATLAMTVVAAFGCAEGGEPRTCPPTSLGGGTTACCVPTANATVCYLVDSGTCVPIPDTGICFSANVGVNAGADAAPVCIPLQYSEVCLGQCGTADDGCGNVYDCTATALVPCDGGCSPIAPCDGG